MTEPAAVSPAALAAQHAALTRRYDEVESAVWKLPDDDAQRRRLEGVLNAIDEQRQAIEILICATPAQTLADAAAQVWQAFHYNGVVDAVVFDRGRDKREHHERIARALCSALKVVAAAAGTERDEAFADVIGGYLDRFPGHVGAAGGIA